MPVNLEQIKKVHFIGIGGIGMSGLARLFLHEGKTVSGSDRAPSAITEALEKEGVKFFPSQEAANLDEGPDMVVYTEAMVKDHPEMAAAAALKVPMMNYFEALGLVANQYYLIAVAGTHGKTTTTAMMIDTLEAAGLDPTAIVGSLRSKTQSNFRAGKSKYFVVEACEYKRDFMYLQPDILVITNIEAEHLDYYKDLSDIQSAFKEFVEKVPADGYVVCDSFDAAIMPVIKNSQAKVVNYMEFFDPNLPLKVLGFNRKNAAPVLAVSDVLGLSKDTAAQSLTDFSGTWRRFEYKGELNGASVYDDYGHHPTEITTTIGGVREQFPDKNLILVFQPHLYSRTAELFDDFVKALTLADRPIITHVYDARNTGKTGATGESLVEAISKQNAKAIYLDSFDDIVADLKSTVTSNDIVLIMGAGDVTKIASALTK